MTFKWNSQQPLFQSVTMFMWLTQDRVCAFRGPASCPEITPRFMKSATRLSASALWFAAVGSVLPGERRGRKAAALLSPFPSLCVHPALSGKDIKSLKRLQAAFKIGARPSSSGSVSQDANFSQVLIFFFKDEKNLQVSCPVQGRPTISEDQSGKLTTNISKVIY